MSDNLAIEIKRLKDRCAWHASRGRASGTYDHKRLKELLAAQENYKKMAAMVKAANKAKTKPATKIEEANNG